MFKIIQGKGFWITFANGYQISVQWGPGNYCDHHGKWATSGEDTAKLGEAGSATAEIAVFRPDGSWIQLDEYDKVRGYLSANQVAEIIALVATNPESLGVAEMTHGVSA